MSNVYHLPIKKKGRKPGRAERKVQLWVRVSPTERDALHALAAQSNMTTAEFMRCVVGFAIREEWMLGPTKSVEAI